MPRFHRVIQPLALIHIIVRFLNHDYVLDSHAARSAYLTRVARYFSQSDWRLLSYALMGTHVHFGAIAGADPLAKITKPLHGSFAHWLKQHGGRSRLGHVVASRPTSKELPYSAAPNLIAYHHNNPVRALVADRAQDSSWTSHLNYIHGHATEWLDVEQGLALCGLSNSATDRALFNELVDSRLGCDLPDPDKETVEQRRSARVHLGSGVEIGNPQASSTGAQMTGIFAPEEATLHPRWTGPLHEIVDLVASTTQISTTTLFSKSRVRQVARARRLYVLCAHSELHRPIGQVASVIGISSQAARKLEQHATKKDRAIARILADSIR